MEPETTLKDQRERRARINRIKVGIIVFIMSVMAASIIMCVILAVKVYSLQKQINTIVDYLNDAAADEEAEDDEMIVESQEAAASKLTLEPTGDAKDYEFPVVDNTQNLWTEGEEHLVYLTFDDGPSGNTDSILDTLSSKGVNATFFCTGKEGEEASRLYKRIVDEGNTIGMHSYTHSYSAIYASPEAFKEDFMKIHDLIYDVTGVDCRIYRFPGGSSNKVSDTDMNVFVDYLGENSVAYFDWNVSSGDASSQPYTEDELIEKVVSNVVKYKQSVVLMHDADAKDTTARALPRLIDELKALGCTILPIEDNTPAIHHSMVSN